MVENLFREADWKSEKHVPVINVLSVDDLVRVSVVVGEEIPHPNTLEHHIKFIELHYKPEKAAYSYTVGRVDFDAHGELNIFTEPRATFEFKADKPGTSIAFSACNLHGLWKNEQKLSF